MKGTSGYPGTRPVLLLGLALIAVVLALLFTGGSTAQQPADSIPAGFDLFETDPEQTTFTFRDQTQIPENFFAEGSKAFDGDVAFGGNPILSFQGQDTGDADTVVKRDAVALAADGSPSEPAKIELVSLSLQAMEAITVDVNGEQQLWDVEAEASPSRPSTGQITVTRTAANGGTFDSKLTVYPKFTFTRLSDGVTRELDVGALPDKQRPEITLTAEGTPWREGCIYPALLVKGLNDRFCPSFTRRRIKVLTVERSRFAAHGIRPAQERLEHFHCYSVGRHSKFKQRDVKVETQFGKQGLRVLAPTQFCNPAMKNREPFVNRTDHLYCYAVKGASLKPHHRVLLRNQFGLFAATIFKPVQLCLPTLKHLAGKRPPRPTRFRTDHFMCYESIHPGKGIPRRSVRVRDQFGARRMGIQQHRLLCAPARKNGGRVIDHPVRHLLCYARSKKAADRPPRVRRSLVARNQFGTQKLKTVLSLELCVPSNKTFDRTFP